MVRAVNQDTNIKLPLARLVSKQSIGFLMSGLKGNYRVQELDLAECALDDEDLERIASRLIEDRGLKTLLLGQNSFSSAAPLVSLLRSKSSQYRRLDLSNCGVDAEAIQSGLPDALGSMRVLEDLQLRECLFDCRPSDAKLLLESVLTGCTNLRAIDLSNNPLAHDNLSHFLTLIANRGAHTIEALALSEVNITQESHSALVTAVGALGLLRKLDLSGNEHLGAQTLQQILRALIQHGQIEDLDISRTSGGNGHQSMQLLGELIKSNKNLRALGLQRLGLSEVAAYHLIDPLSSALNVEALNFNHNNLGPIFVQNLVNRLATSKQPGNARKDSGGQSPGSRSGESSIMTDETGGNNDEEIISSLSKRGAHKSSGKQPRCAGLVSLSFEGNLNISDRGAEAIANLIQTQSAFSNNLKIVNLNECGITNTGFEQLKQALLERATLANSLNLTHVKITIERNNIEQMNNE